MNVEQIFDGSFERVSTESINGNSFFADFYNRFLASDIRIKQRFEHTDMEAQKSMLRKSFYSLFSFYISADTDYLLKKIAYTHSRTQLDIPPDLYDIWLESLIESVRLYDPEFNDDVELAWRLVLTPGIVFMKFYYYKDSVVAD